MNLRATTLFLPFAAVLFAPACSDKDPSAIPTTCGTSALDTSAACGAGDPKLPPEPTLPTTVCQTLTADKSTPDENGNDMARIQAALNACKNRGAVKLVSDGANDAFLAGHLQLDSATLWIDAGVTLYASRDPSKFDKGDGNCGLTGVSDSGGCLPLVSVSGTNPAIVGDGIIDGQGGEPLYQKDYSWWDLSNALRSSNGSAPNPALIEVKKATGFVLYRITMHDSPKAHVKLSANPAGGSCSKPGAGYTVWGVTIVTPSKWVNSKGTQMTPYYARNTDGFDPGAGAATSCGVMACNTISTGDDQIAIKGAYGFTDFVVAHNHFGSGHGMSVGSETNGGVSNVDIYDLTIDGSQTWTGAPTGNTADFNGIRVKSDVSRGGAVENIKFSNVCVRDAKNPIVINSSYNLLYGGTSFPKFGSIEVRDFRAVTCTALNPPNVSVEGLNSSYPAGPVVFDNVTVDGVSPISVASQFASVTLGPRPVNFIPSGTGTTVTSAVTTAATTVDCKFPELPVPHAPPGWVW